MAEETQGVQNKWLLLVAAVLGVLVAIIYNVDRARALRLAEGESRSVLVYTRPLEADERIKADDLTTKQLNADFAGEIRAVTEGEKGSVIGQVVGEDVKKGEYVRWAHLSGTEETKPSERITDGMILRTVPIDSVTSPGHELKPGDRINLLGIFQVVRGKPSAYRVVSNVRVLEAGGVGVLDLKDDEESSRRRRGSSSYRAIDIELPPDLSIKVANLLTHAIGKTFAVEVRNPDSTYAGIDDPNAYLEVTFNEELEELAKYAAAGSDSGGSRPPTSR